MSVGPMIYLWQFDEWFICDSWSNGLVAPVGWMIYLCQLVQWFICDSWSNGLFVPVGPMVYLCQLVEWFICASWSNGLFVPVGPMIYLVFKTRFLFVYFRGMWVQGRAVQSRTTMVWWMWLQVCMWWCRVWILHMFTEVPLTLSIL